jgi:hypothetical protein
MTSDRKLVLCGAALVGIGLATQAPANEAHDSLMGAGEEQRRVALAAAVTASGRQCALATETFFRGFGPSEEAFWNVRCRGGDAYSIAIYPDARVSVLECGILARKARIECFRPLDEQQ